MARSLLIVDSDPISTEALRRIVGHLAFSRILEARTLVEAKTATDRSSPDIIVVSHKMPQLNGIQVAQTILTAKSNSLVLFLFGDNSMIDGAFAAGALGYVRTDHIEADLPEAIEQLLLGRAFFTVEAVRLLRMRHHRNPYPGEHATLTPREVTVLQQVALGTPMREIATNLELSIRTVEHHRATIMAKLKLQSVSDLVRYAIRTGLIQA
jgi:DNA-binding NarL/FixJ family response regulator